jgi:hypothetical protein
MPRMRAAYFLSAALPVFFAGVMLALAGCTTGVAGPKGNKMIIARARAPFFKQGPAQPTGPDLELTKGQRVTLVASSLGYSRVITADNLTGYVETDVLAPAPYEPPPPPAPKPKPWAGDRTIYSSLPTTSEVEGGGSDSPLFDLGDVPPLPPAEEAKPKPGFKFRF